MKKTILLTAALASIALSSCNKENEQTTQTAKYITVSSNIGTMTRVTTTGNTSVFDEGDKISVYAWTGTANEVTAATLVENNAENTLQNAKWIAEPMMKWTDMTTPHFFLSVHPTRAITNFTSDAVVVDPANQAISDLLVAVNSGVGQAGLIATQNPVPLEFHHAMSRLDIELTYRNEFEETPTVTSLTTQAKKTGTIDYLTSAITTTGAAELFDLPVTTANKQYSSVIIPQGVQTITIAIDGKDYIYNHPQPIALNKGMVQTVKLIVGRNRIELDEVIISNWGTETDIEGGEAVDVK